jgi:hypothetical protein
MGVAKADLKRRGIRCCLRAVSPAISTVILTAAIVVLLCVAIAFANNFLTARMAESEYSAMKQFMQTVGLQVDDVAWTIGRTQTIRYSCRYGDVAFEKDVLNYTIYTKTDSSFEYFCSFKGSLILFNMPTSKYSIGNNFYQNIFPSSSYSFLQLGTSAPITRIFAVEKLPMYDGSFLRVVIVPSFRLLNSTIISGSGIDNYYKLYFPVFILGERLGRSQSVTLTSDDINVYTKTGVKEIKIAVSFLRISDGFDNGFFNFPAQPEIIDVPDGSILEVYVSNVTVSFGVHA